MGVSNAIRKVIQFKSSTSDSLMPIGREGMRNCEFEGGGGRGVV